MIRRRLTIRRRPVGIGWKPPQNNLIFPRLDGKKPGRDSGWKDRRRAIVRGMDDRRRAAGEPEKAARPASRPAALSARWRWERGRGQWSWTLRCSAKAVSPAE